ncbi:unnamed protein product [Rotaria sp. Silwood2]|nr:unnamed protein product [Rotaria sp. Silwood2]CAF4808856.1 unnamed protein product [Rotaria sp. Silwood2]
MIIVKFLVMHDIVYCGLVLDEYSNDNTFPDIWIIEKYTFERNIDRSLEFSIAPWLLERNEEEF